MEKEERRGRIGTAESGEGYKLKRGQGSYSQKGERREEKRRKGKRKEREGKGGKWRRGEKEEHENKRKMER